jgi:hypothetical protein
VQEPEPGGGGCIVTAIAVAVGFIVLIYVAIWAYSADISF